MKLESMKEQARRIKAHTLAVYFAASDPRMPFCVRVLAILVAAYALSPIDLIPDFIPVIGLLDDILLVPAGLALVVRLTPSVVMESARIKAKEASESPTSYSAATFIVVVWLAVLWVFLRWALNAIRT